MNGALGSLSRRARAKRFAMLLERFPDLPEMRVLDLGGEVAAWRGMPARPRELVLLNLDVIHDAQAAVPWASQVVGDACAPPADLGKFDLVYSNSVIEHIGGHEQRVRFADVVRRHAPHHWIQTPYRYFPVEQHAMAPMLQFLPLGAAARVLKRWPIGNHRFVNSVWPETQEGAEQFTSRGPEPLRDSPLHQSVRGLLSIELLSATEMRFLFPASVLLRERIAGMTKSLIACR